MNKYLFTFFMYPLVWRITQIYILKETFFNVPVYNIYISLTVIYLFHLKRKLCQIFLFQENLTWAFVVILDNPPFTRGTCQFTSIYKRDMSIYLHLQKRHVHLPPFTRGTCNFPSGTLHTGLTRVSSIWFLLFETKRVLFFNSIII